MTDISTDNDSDIITSLESIRDFIRWGSSQLTEQGVFLGHGIATPLHESAALVLHALHQPYNLDDCYLSARLTHAERKKVIALIKKRIEQRIPVAYLTHEALFAGLSFYVDERVLVPRSPIAELIEQRFEPWVDESQVYNILDLCTGSACIAIACAYAFPEAQVDAVELSEHAMTVAETNISRHQMEDQLALYQSDLFSALPEKPYDLIVSNPPYVAIEEWESLPDEYHKEPEMGFTGGESGLDLVIKILAQADKYLAERGILIIEVGSSAETLQNMFPQIPFYWLDFERGGDGVFLLTAEQIKQYHKLFLTKI